MAAWFGISTAPDGTLHSAVWLLREVAWWAVITLLAALLLRLMWGVAGCARGGNMGRTTWAFGGVRRIEITERETPVFGGAEFGAVGPYERLHGTVFGELDPTHP